MKKLVECSADEVLLQLVRFAEFDWNRNFLNSLIECAAQKALQKFEFVVHQLPVNQKQIERGGQLVACLVAGVFGHQLAHR